ncbi:hypothetical protein HUG17_6353 [Dermatophagoides farinae]|uniref:Uncharacterized protein n=1 Tax=Dermatophagoides farinae TaxID=6954 RepID=A0A9D4P3D1_DERFA|nr:hypothetical protein HUG17_6353 [Dermatophagoides farinae]
MRKIHSYLVNILEIESGTKQVGEIRDHDRQLVLDHKDWIGGHMLMVIEPLRKLKGNKKLIDHLGSLTKRVNDKLTEVSGEIGEFNENDLVLRKQNDSGEQESNDGIVIENVEDEEQMLTEIPREYESGQDIPGPEFDTREKGLTTNEEALNYEPGDDVQAGSSYLTRRFERNFTHTDNENDSDDSRNECYGPYTVEEWKNSRRERVSVERKNNLGKKKTSKRDRVQEELSSSDSSSTSSDESDPSPKRSKKSCKSELVEDLMKAFQTLSKRKNKGDKKSDKMKFSWKNVDKIKKFKATVDDFGRFFSQYNEFVHNTNASNTIKLMALKSLLPDSAEKFIAGYDEDQYETALNDLKLYYTNKQAMKENALKVVKELPAVEYLSDYDRMRDNVAIVKSMYSMLKKDESNTTFIDTEFMSAVAGKLPLKILRSAVEGHTDEICMKDYLITLERKMKRNSVGTTSNKIREPTYPSGEKSKTGVLYKTPGENRLNYNQFGNSWVANYANTGSTIQSCKKCVERHHPSVCTKIPEVRMISNDDSMSGKIANDAAK